MKYNRHKFLVDTGSELTCIRENLLKKNVNIIKEEAKEITGISNIPVKTLGTVMGTIKLGRKFIAAEFNVLPGDSECPFEALLGMNILENCDIIKSKKLLKFYKLNEEIPLICPNYKLKGRTQKLFIIRKKFKDGHYFLEKEEIKTGIFVPDALIKFQSGKSIISAINILNEDVDFSDSLNNLKISKIKDSDYTEVESYSMDRNKNIKFSILNIKTNREETKGRENKLEELIDVPHMNIEEKHCILKLCREYSHLFYLDGDLLTYTDAVHFIYGTNIISRLIP